MLALVEINYPADTNVIKKTKAKLDDYEALLRHLQMPYQDYRFDMILLIMGVLDYAARDLKFILEKLNFHKKEPRNITRNLLTILISVTITVVKTFMGFDI